jgi:aryl-alcohol dehydrogenase-like predicted oxidoreductase
MTAADVVGGGHSLSPTFLSNQIQRSLANLGLATIDVYYLHNPEQQRLALDGPRFRNVIAGAFSELESQVSKGTIRCYGCATWNGFRLDPASPGHLNLEDLVEIARETAGDDHHFQVIQLPLNLAMTEAVRAPTQTVKGQRMPLLEAAAALGVSVVASASLMQSQLTRGLPAELAVAFPSLTTDAQRALAFARTLPLCAALVGMRSIDHLSENLGAAKEVIVS